MTAEISPDVLGSEIYAFVTFLKQVNAERHISGPQIKLIREDYEKILAYRQSGVQIPSQLRPYLELLDYQYNESLKRFLDGQQKTDFAELLQDPELKDYMSNKRLETPQDDSVQSSGLISKFLQLGKSLSGQEPGSGKDLSDPRLDSKRNIVRFNIGSKFLNKFVSGFCLFVAKLRSSEHKMTQPEEFKRELAKVKLYEENYEKIRAFDLDTMEIERETLEQIAEFDEAMADVNFRRALAVEPRFLDFCEKLRLFLKNLMLHRVQARQRDSIQGSEADVEYYESRKSNGNPLGRQSGVSTLKPGDLNYSMDREVSNQIEIADAQEAEDMDRGGIELGRFGAGGSRLSDPNQSQFKKNSGVMSIGLKSIGSGEVPHTGGPEFQSIEVNSVDRNGSAAKLPNDSANNGAADDPNNYFSLSNYHTPQNYYQIKHSLTGEARDVQVIMPDSQARQGQPGQGSASSNAPHTIDQLRPGGALINIEDSNARSNASRNMSLASSNPQGGPTDQFLFEQKRLSDKSPLDFYSDSGFDMNSGTNSERRPFQEEAHRSNPDPSRTKNLFIQNSNFSEVENASNNDMLSGARGHGQATAIELFDGSFKQPVPHQKHVHPTASVGTGKKPSDFAKSANKAGEVFAIDDDHHAGLAAAGGSRGSQGKGLFNSFSGQVGRDPLEGSRPQAINDLASDQSSLKSMPISPNPEPMFETPQKGVSLGAFEESNIIFQDRKSAPQGDDVKDGESKSKLKSDSLLEGVNKDFLISGVSKSGTEKGGREADGQGSTTKRKSETGEAPKNVDVIKKEDSGGSQGQAMVTELERYLAADYKKHLGDGRPGLNIFSVEYNGGNDAKGRKTAAFTDPPVGTGEVREDLLNGNYDPRRTFGPDNQPNINGGPLASPFGDSKHFMAPQGGGMGDSKVSPENSTTNFKDMATFSNLVRQCETELADIPEISKTDVLSEFKKLFDRMEVGVAPKARQQVDPPKFSDHNFPPLIYSIVNGFGMSNQREWRFFQWRRLSCIFPRRYKIIFRCNKMPTARNSCTSQAFKTLMLGLTTIGDTVVDWFVQNYERQLGRLTLKAFTYDGVAYLDDYIPVQCMGDMQRCNESFSPVFLPPVVEGAEVNIFFSVLEKYFAKMFGSYENLHAASFEELLRVVSVDTESIDLSLVRKFDGGKLGEFVEELRKDFADPEKLTFVVRSKKGQTSAFVKGVRADGGQPLFQVQRDGRNIEPSLGDVLAEYDKMFIVKLRVSGSKHELDSRRN